MGASDLRGYLDGLEGRGQLLRVKQEVDTLDEMGAFIARADYERLDKALLFERPKGFDIPVLANTVGTSMTRIAATFGVPVEGAVPRVAQKMGQVLQSGGIPPVTVDRDKAPCKEIVLTGSDVDLGKIPILRTNPEDGSGGTRFLEGRFIGSLACSKPAPNAHNLSYHRFEIQGPRHGTVWIFRLTGDARSMEEHWGAKIDDPETSWDASKGKPFPLAFVLGVTPEFLLVGANPALPYKNDDFAFIGGALGRPVEMVKCETIDVDVPASAEIVIEGLFHPFKFDQQGRYASFNGYYDEPRRRPVFEVTAITMRKNPIYQHVHIGLPLNECNNMAAFFRSVRVFRDVQMVMPNVQDVFVDPAAGVGFTVHVSIKKGRIGEPKMAMMRAYTALGGFCKHVFVYDHDIDIRNPHERDWALAHRFMADRDLLVIPNVMGMTIDPLAQGAVGSRARLGVYDGHLELPLNVRTFMGVDCTVPLGLKMMERVSRKSEVETRVDVLWRGANGGR
jgi:2,5-furandicarboxylate decarboxylase 1